MNSILNIMGFTKVSMNLNQRTIENVDELSKLIGESNKTRVVSSSLELAKQILEMAKKGAKFIVRNPDGSEQELKFIM